MHPVRAAVAACPALAALLATAAIAAGPAKPPVAPIEDVTDVHWGVPVHDPYRYMENLDDPRTKPWIKAQADYTTEIMTGVAGRDELKARIAEFDSGRPWRVSSVEPQADGGLFYLKQAASENLPRLFARPAGATEERLVFDPSTRTPADGGHFSISWFQASPDGKQVLLGLAPSGSEEDILYVIDVATGAALADTITLMEAGYVEPMWLPDGSGFFYSRRRELPADAPETEGYRLTRAFLHRLGTPVTGDPMVFAFGVQPGGEDVRGGLPGGDPARGLAVRDRADQAWRLQRAHALHRAPRRRGRPRRRRGLAPGLRRPRLGDGLRRPRHDDRPRDLAPRAALPGRAHRPGLARLRPCERGRAPGAARRRRRRRREGRALRAVPARRLRFDRARAARGRSAGRDARAARRLRRRQPPRDAPGARRRVPQHALVDARGEDLPLRPGDEALHRHEAQPGRALRRRARLRRARGRGARRTTA